ncbi:ROK family protein [Pediococcus pentosaceus]|uniref:ROK family protein n=1 Tax=Pediococcus pentosaceus TaxID=1255 RepID=UPI002F2672FD
MDIGGTTIKFAVVADNGTIEKKWHINTDTENNGQNIMAAIVDSVKYNIDRHSPEYKGIGVGVPGPVENGVVTQAVNLGWGSTPVQTLLEDKLGLTTAVVNDANAAALGELWQGSKNRVNDLLFVTLGTGVGGGVVVDGKILNGSHSAGGEIGHIPVQSDQQRICGCGNINCLETYTSASGMITTMNDLIKDTEMAKVNNAKEIFDRARKNDTYAKETITRTINCLASAIAGIINTIDPQEIVIGGGVAEAGDIFLKPLKTEINTHAFPRIKNNFNLRKATLGNDAGVLGAVYQSMQSR